MQKEMSKRRMLSFILMLAMVLGMVLEVLPPLEVRAATEGGEWPNSYGTVVHVSTIDELKDYLTRLEDYTIVLDKDIAKQDNNPCRYWCTIQGTKVLDVNGHSIKVSNNSRGDSSLFLVVEGATLIINDSAHSSDRDDVEIFYNCKTEAMGKSEYYMRNCIEVQGLLIQNGGYIRTGRKTSWYNVAIRRGDSGTQYKIVTGDGVRVLEGGTFVMNGGWVRGYGGTLSDVGIWGRFAISCNSKMNGVYINNGYLEGGCGSALYSAGSNAPHGTERNEKVHVMSGELQTFDESNISLEDRWGDTIYYYKRQVPAEHVSTQEIVDRANYVSSLNYAFVTPKVGQCDIYTVYGNLHYNEKTQNHFYLVDLDKTVIRIRSEEEAYFQGIPSKWDAICGHVKEYWWQVFKGNECVAELKTDKKEVDLKQDFAASGFQPAVGATYTVNCQIVEQLMDKVAFRQNSNDIDVTIRIPEGTVELSEANFPDAAFRGYLSETYDLNQDQYLVPEELENINVLNVGGNASFTISSLEGVKLLPYVMEIYAYENPGLRKVGHAGAQGVGSGTLQY